MFQYPRTPKRPVTEDVHGTPYTDNYRWLEVENKDTEEWLAAQNQFTKEWLNQCSSRDYYREQITKDFAHFSASAPLVRNDVYFWSELRPEDNQQILMWKKGETGEPQELINVNKLSQAGQASLDYWYVSPQAHYLIYGISENGSEDATLAIKDLHTGKNLADTIPYARHTNIAWDDDEQSFYYTRLPTPGTVPVGDELYYYAVYYHQIGSNGVDQKIWGDGRPKQEMIHEMVISEDSRYLVICCSDNWTENEVHIYDAKLQTYTALAVGYHAQFSCAIKGTTLYICTNYHAPNNRILKYELTSKDPVTIEDLPIVVPENENILQVMKVSKSMIIGVYLINACASITLFDHQGNFLKTLSSEPLSEVVGVAHNRKTDLFFFSTLSFLHSQDVYRYLDGELTHYLKASAHLDPNQFMVEQVWYPSKDGTQIPMFVVRSKSTVLDGNNPTVIYAYGGFGSVTPPFYPRRFLGFIKKGGILVVANIRGGGEFGIRWHQDGMLAKKQNSYDDMAAAAQYLIEKNYTNSHKLAINGGSNGGLLVAAVAMQHPELFGAVVSQVPLTDMLHFHLFLMGGRWRNEYGDPEKQTEWEWIKKWSPYHNVKANTKYPNFLFTTADQDTRVHPLHARKMAAQLQQLSPQSLTLLRSEAGAGHGPGKSKIKLVEESTDILSFIDQSLNS